MYGTTFLDSWVDPKLLSYSFVNFLTLNGSKKILIDPMIPIQIFKSIPKRSTTRSKKNHDHTTHRSEDIE